jgi:hypothetical protein
MLNYQQIAFLRESFSSAPIANLCLGLNLKQDEYKVYFLDKIKPLGIYGILKEYQPFDLVIRPKPKNNELDWLYIDHIAIIRIHNPKEIFLKSHYKKIVNNIQNYTGASIYSIYENENEMLNNWDTTIRYKYADILDKIEFFTNAPMLRFSVN